ncbi:MAG: hypothetical protein GQ534_07405 [Candidatus Delongbacteria bacterium]|nr:hypothetical protein [Candidatus Delongbacteria bacterium]
MKYLKYILIMIVVLIFVNCARTVEDYWEDSGVIFTFIYSYNFETGEDTQLCIPRNFNNYSPNGDYYLSSKIEINEKGNRILNIKAYDINSNTIINDVVDSLFLRSSMTNLDKIVFSNNGEMITFSDSLIYTVNVDGTDFKMHTIGKYSTFSPDDSKLMYVDEQGYISTIRIDNGNIERILLDDEVTYPIYNPLGDEIYYYSDKVIKKYYSSESLVTIIANMQSDPVEYIKFSDNGNKKLILGDVGYTLDEYENINLIEEITFYGDISPDGTKLAYLDVLEEYIWVTDFEGTNEERISWWGCTSSNNIYFSKDRTKLFYLLEIGVK